MGEPMLSPEARDHLVGDMRSVHEGVMYLEKSYLRMPNPPYPLYLARVPNGMGFVDTYPGDVFFIRFDEIFDLYHMKRLPTVMVRLVALTFAHQVKTEESRNFAIMDPYYMRESNLKTPAARLTVTQFVERFFLENKGKGTLLVPYFPE